MSEGNPRVRTVTLDHPIKRGEIEMATITLRKPVAGDLRGLKMAEILNGDVASMARIIPRISDPFISEEEINSGVVEIEDFTAMIGEVISFFPQAGPMRDLSQAI